MPPKLPIGGIKQSRIFIPPIIALSNVAASTLTVNGLEASSSKSQACPNRMMLGKAECMREKACDDWESGPETGNSKWH